MKPASCMSAAMGVLLFGLAAMPAMADPAKKELTGQQIAFDNKKGNCLGCHAVPTDPAAVTQANIGPPLVVINQRYPDKAKLRAQIWDATVANPKTVMPPFGRHSILTEQEIDKVVEYIFSL